MKYGIKIYDYPNPGDTQWCQNDRKWDDINAACRYCVEKQRDYPQYTYRVEERE